MQSQSSVEESSNVRHARPSDKDLHALSQFAGQLNSKLLEEVNTPPNNNGENVDLDNLFAFLSEIHGDGNKNTTLEEIENQMTELATDFDEEIQLSAREARYFLFLIFQVLKIFLILIYFK